jgi:hypothetical protein
MGMGISFMQPALPAVVRDWVPSRVALGTATYSNALLVGEAISASLTIPVVLPAGGNSWRWSLVVWAVPVFADRLARDMGDAAAARIARGARRRAPLVARLARSAHVEARLISGFASSLYFATNAYLPDYLRVARPRRPARRLASALNWVQIPASILMLMYAERLTRRRCLSWRSRAPAVIAVLGLLYMSDAWIVPWCGVIGFCNAFLLILTLALPPLIAKPEDVSRLGRACSRSATCAPSSCRSSADSRGTSRARACGLRAGARLRLGDGGAGRDPSLRARGLEELRLAVPGGRHEKRRVQVVDLLVEAVALHRLAEALLQQLGERALPHHPRPELRIVLAALAHVPDPSTSRARLSAGSASRASP